MNNKTNPGTPSPQNPNDKFRRFLRSPWIYPLLFAVLVLLLSFFGQQRTAVTKEIPYSEFLTMLRENQVQAVEVSGDTLTIQPKGSNNLSAPLYYTTRIISDSALVSELIDAGVEFGAVEASQPISFFDVLIVYVIPIALFVLMAF